MFLEFYGLKEQPFGVTPDPRFICPSRTHSKAFNYLSRGLEAGCGFLALIAKPGMGKTTLVFQLLKQLEQTSRAIFLFQTQCDSRELLRYLLSGLGLDVAGQDIVSMHQRLNQLLARELLAGRRFVLIIDECQNLDDSVLETVRMLSNFETARAKLMQIILVGQTQLADNLLSPRLAQLRQRISILSRLEPLTRAETAHYIAHRLQVAGYVGPPLFTPRALEEIWERCEGIPRNINNVCFNALLVGCALGRRRIDSTIVGQVLADLEMNPRELKSMVTQQEPSAQPRAPSNLSPRMTKVDLDLQQDDSNDAQVVVVESEVAPPELVPQVPKAQASPPVPTVPLPCAGAVRSDSLDWRQVNSGDEPKFVSDSSPNPPGFLSWFEAPVQKPQITQPLAPSRKAHSDPSTVRDDFSGRKQVASASAVNVTALSDAIDPAQKTSEAGRPAAPPPQGGPELSDPVI